MLPEQSLKSMNVLIATPCYISAVTMNYTISMFTLSSKATVVGLRSTLYMRSESLITRARNKVVRTLMASEGYTHLFFIDSDIQFQPEAVFRLLLADRDIVAGIYPLKKMNWPEKGLPQGTTREAYETNYMSYPFNPIGHGTRQVSEFVDADGFVEVAEAPTGFMCIKREVFPKLMKAYPELQYRPDGPPGHPQEHLHWRFFDCMVDHETNRYLSEDFAFCRLWRDIGGKVYADSESRLGHLGQHLYQGNLRGSLMAQGRW